MTQAQQTYGRWTVVRAAAPEQRRSSKPERLARTLVACVCGHRKIVWQEDLQGGRSTGCESRRCMVRHQVVEELSASLSDLEAKAGGDLVGLLQGRLKNWLVTAREQDQNEGWQANAGRNRHVEADESD